MDHRRRFSKRERIAMYLASDGKCSNCGKDLPEGWHADHVEPWSKGGATDVVNGQALCPECNMEKSDKPVVKYRPWQKRFLDKFRAHQRDNFLLVAVPASGKTVASCAAVYDKMHGENVIDKVLIVVPNISVKISWAKTAERFGIQLNDMYQNSGPLKNHYDGIVTTFQSIDSAPDLYRHHLSHGRWMVVIDEVHHLGESDKSSWGKSAARALEPSVFRLLLSGTPFRTDRARIPFVPYYGNTVSPDFEFSYEEAVRKPEECVRKVYFKHYSSEIKWMDLFHGDIQTTTFEDELDEKDANWRLREALKALQPESVVMQMIKDADNQLSEEREVNPNAAGMVLCIDTKHANQVAEMMNRTLGYKPDIALSDENGAHETIRSFRDSSRRWLVAVQMVSEGTDIPRLQVGVYATTTTTELFWRQAVGRFIRAEDGGDATIYHVDDPRLLQMAQHFTDSVDAVVIEEANEILNTPTVETDKQQALMTSEVISANGELSGVTHFGDRVDGVELAQIERFKQQLGLTDSVEKLAFFFREYSQTKYPEPVVEKREAPQKTIREQEEDIRKSMKRIVGQIYHRHGVAYQDINRMLNMSVNITSVNDKNANIDVLKARLRNAVEWVNTGRPPYES